ncbi:hypothetical protein PUMCH_000995 [Australozyma saopauloensis]|uniref:Protein transport protein BOS1 n=1 Tax=Australozyma saopauloensis TaxID=291208 RepID=A0AAX4H5J4_9ASCO|nr:hypothetical protein PUMCH_000995 [[Candida] saopauloensis]
MNSLYNHGVKQTQLLSRDLAAFEKNVTTAPLSLQGQVSTSLAALSKTIKEYGDLIKQNKAFVEEKHPIRLQKFEADYAQFLAKFNSLRQLREAQAHSEARLELIGRRNVNSENPYHQDSLGYAANQQQLSYLEGLYKEKTSIQRGANQLDQILEMGQNALDDLVDQNDTLRRIGMTFEQSLVTLGVSRGTIKRVERRAREDKWIFIGLAIIFFVMCYYIIKWFR